MNSETPFLSIAVCNQKGGVGKTTTSSTLAQLAAEQIGDTVLIDLDPQQSAKGWAVAAEVNGEPVSYRIETIDTSRPAQIRAKTLKMVSGAQVAVIDTPPGNPNVIDAAAETVSSIGGAVLVPTGGSPLDISRTLEMVDALSWVEVPVIALLCRIKSERYHMVKEARALLAAAEIPVMGSSVRDLQAIGQGSDRAPGKQAQKEYIPVLNELVETITSKERA